MARYGFFRRPQRKVCLFCKEKIVADYKDVDLLRKFITEQGKMLPRRATGKRNRASPLCGEIN
jgi:small subunit ribosomal protein S18